MPEILPSSLEALSAAPEPAWLWDGARGRIVWANPPGIAWFDGQSLFDLIDRPFDPQEPGVARIAGFARSLRRGQVETALLHFPSMTPAPLACRVLAHGLPDGRAGVLVVAAESPARAQEARKEETAQAFELLPMAALLVDRFGSVRHLNAAAIALLGAGQRAELAAILGGSEAAADLLARTAEAGLASAVRRLTLRFGPRDVRITARRLTAGENDEAAALVLLDDITERRALERSLAAPQATPASSPIPAPEPSEAEPPAAAPAAIPATDSAAPVPDEAAVPVVPPITATAVPSRPAPYTPSPSDAETFERLGETLRREAGTPAPEVRPPQRAAMALPDILRKPLDRMAEPVLIARDGKLLYANPAACGLFGYRTASEVLSDTQLWNRFSQLGQSLPAGRIDLDGGRHILARVTMQVIPWLSGPARQFVLQPVGADALDRVALQIAPPPAPPAAALRVAPPEAVTLDVPPAPALEKAPPAAPDDELRAVLDTVADGIITLDAEGRIHSFSAGAEAIFGFRIAEVLGRPFLDLMAPESRKAVKAYLAALQGPGLANVFNDGREVMALVQQGGSVPLFLTIGRLQSKASQAAFCAVVRDITQWKKTETELREAKEQAEATSRQKSEFLARISHELRTPLNAIMGFSEVMRLQRFGKIGNDKYLGYVNDIHASGSHLLSLINDLLDLSKVEAGKLELNFTSVGLDEVADHVLRLMQEQATAARVILRKSMPPDLPHVVADLRSMRQILLNLVSNALKFTDPGGQVIVSAQMTPGGELKLRVKDTGIGMSEEQLRDALEPFRRVTTDGRDAPGTGLGLPLTRALAEANRTRFEISSEPRKGTLVEITFPTTRVLAG